MRKARRHDRHARESDRHLELITGSKRWRARSAREKAAIVAEAVASGANVSKIRRDHGLNRGLLFTWRRQVRRARPSPVAEATSDERRDPVFVPVEIEGPIGNPAGRSRARRSRGPGEHPPPARVALRWPLRRVLARR